MFLGSHICWDSFRGLFFQSGTGKKVHRDLYMNGWRKKRGETGRSGEGESIVLTEEDEFQSNEQ